MQNIEEILKANGVELTEEQSTAIKKAVAENYKTVAEVEKKVGKLEAERDNYKEQLDTANETLKKFDGVDAEGMKKQIDELLFQNILAREEVKKEVRTSIGKVTVKMSTDVNIPFSDLLSAKIHIWEIETEGYANRVNPIEIIRGVRKINGH